MTHLFVAVLRRTGVLMDSVGDSSGELAEI
jgi:hypothetical protein